MRQLRKRIAGRFSLIMLLSITSQQITDITQNVAGVISDFWPLVVLILGVYLGLWILQAVVALTTGKTTERLPFWQNDKGIEAIQEYHDFKEYYDNDDDDELWP